MNIIQKLNELKVEDLKNIKSDDVKTYLIKNIEVSICIILGILTLFMNMNSFKKYNAEMSAIKENITKLEETLEAAKEDEKAQKKLDQIVETFPKSITINQLSQTITEYARRHNVTIESYSPENEEKKNGIIINAMSIRTFSPDFDAIINFLKDIETDESAIRIKSWSGNQGRITENSESKRNDKINNNNISSLIIIETYEVEN